MDLARQIQHLEQAETHVRQGAKHVLAQELRVAELEICGQDASLARAVLDTYRCTQALHVQHRDRVLRELGL
jgi:hypothetical protein